MKTTFLVTYYAQPELLEICLDSIKKYHPDATIIISQQQDDEPVELPGIKVIKHDMKSGSLWADVAIGLLKECQTDIAVFIEHDAFLVNSLDLLLEAVQNGIDMIGPEDNFRLERLIREYPNMICQNFFILNAKKMKEFGLDKVWTRVGGESGHGIGQTMENKRFMSVHPSGYGYGTLYGFDGKDYVHHFWWGSYPKRYVEFDDINKLFLECESERIVKDYKSNKLDFNGPNSSFHNSI